MRRVEHLGEALEQRAELEELEQALHLAEIGRLHAERGDVAEVDVDRGVAPQHHHLGVLAHPGLVLAARLSRSLGVCLSRLAKMPSSPP